MNELICNTEKRMSSLEIAEAAEKNHLHVMRDIRELIDQGAIDQSRFGLISYVDSMNREQPAYSLDFESSMVLVTGYDAKRRRAVIRRWVALEKGEAVPLFAGLDPNAIHDQLIEVPVIKNLIDLFANLAADHNKLYSEHAALVRFLNSRPVARPASVLGYTGNIPAFVEACCRISGAAATSKDELYTRYRRHCQDAGGLVETYDTFFKLLYRTGLPIRKAKLGADGERRYVVKGVALRKDEVTQ